MASVLNLTADIQVLSPHRAYGLVISPPFSIHDEFTSVFDDQAVNKVSAYVDRNAKVLMGQPIPYIQDTLFVADGGAWSVILPGGTAWHDEIINPETGFRALLMDDASNGVLSQLTYVGPVPYDTGYYVRLVRGEPPAAAIKNGANVYWKFALGNGLGTEAQPGLQIVARMGEPFILEATQDLGTTWYEVARDNSVKDCEAYLESHNRTINIAVLPVNRRNTVSIYLNGDIDLSYRADEFTLPAMAPYFEAKNGKVALAFYPMAFPLTWSVESALKLVGFNPTVLPAAILYPPQDEQPTGTTVDIAPSSVVNQHMLYLVGGTNPPAVGFGSAYSSKTAMVQFAQIDFKPDVHVDTTDLPTQLNPRRVREVHQFNWNDLSITRSATITCDNHGGRWSKLAGQNVGVRAVSLSRGWNGLNALGMVGWLGETLTYDRMDPREEITFDAYDRTFPLLRRKCGYLPPGDGWCIYARLRFLAGIGGVAGEWMVSIPDCPTGPNPPNCPHYRLPLGTGISPRMNADVRTPLWMEMIRTARFKRLVLGFTPDGYLEAPDYDPGNLPVYVNPDLLEVIPYAPQPIVIGGIPALNEFTGQLCTTVSVADIRSSVKLVGRNPSPTRGDDSLIIVDADDQETGIVYDLDNPIFLGFFDQYYDQDPLYTSEEFMQPLADRIYEQCTIPGVNCRFGTWLQRGLDVLQRIYVYEPHTLGESLREMYVTGLVHDYEVQGNRLFRGTTQIQCKSVLNL